MRNLFVSLALAVGLSSLAAGATVATALAPLDTLNGALVQLAAADPIPGGARDVVAIDPAPAGSRITVYLSNGAADILPPCRYEDGRHCYWDAGGRGNGIGRDFIVTRGRVHYVDIAHMIRTYDQLA